MSVIAYYVTIAVQKTAIITIIISVFNSCWSTAIVAISYDIDTLFYQHFAITYGFAATTQQIPTGAVVILIISMDLMEYRIITHCPLS